jgi:hypothetical protein
MKSTLMLLAGALAFASASAEPPHGQNCPPGQQHCQNNGPQGGHDQMNGPGKMGGPNKMGDRNQMGGPGTMHPGSMGPGPKPGPMMGGPAPKSGPAFKGGPGWNNNATDWHWQDNRGGWHRDHDRYWRPNFRGGFVPRDRLFFVLRQHSFNRFDGDPYWFRGHFVVRTFDRWGRPIMVELNPYTGEFIGVIRP